ncbi:MAG: cytochrome C, partial [Chitinophagaceae bacterium]|nr:cytochrome C [Chitinophagaceae bacterium]
MRKVFKVMLVFLLVVIVGLALVAFYVKKGMPNVGDAPDIKIELTKERVERGNYLANNVMACMDCHS